MLARIGWRSQKEALRQIWQGFGAEIEDVSPLPRESRFI
jgi:hypothetical protein